MFKKAIVILAIGLMCTATWATKKRADEAGGGPVAGGQVNSPAGSAGAAAGNAGVADGLAKTKAEQPVRHPKPKK